jgi:hypothetical protein
MKVGKDGKPKRVLVLGATGALGRVVFPSCQPWTD